MPWRAIVPLIAAIWFGLSPARAQAEPHSYALVIGANRGGYGQEELRYARADAQHFAQLLVELGRIPKANVILMLDPMPAQIEQALVALRARLAGHASAGEHSKLLFYYSGHARARALSLATGELPLDALRQSLVSLPSTLTVAVLDACQSGAISGVKGAVPATDFSVSSVSDLTNAGVAVMASSTAAELSQESPELAASYFTHHLLTGLRGAADRDRDLSVSLDEAYAYAYQNTLSDTLRTRVGSQHATLEIELKGHGGVPLTFTADADAQLVLPEPIEGRVVVQQRGRGAVLAELTKARGAVISLAVPHGQYEVLLRRGIAAAPLSCTLNLARGAQHRLVTAGCDTVELPPLLAAKGGQASFERWFIEIGFARRFAIDDDYIETLHDFRFDDAGSGDGGSYTPTFAGGVGLSRHFSLLARSDRLAKRTFHRSLGGLDYDETNVRFAYRTWAVALGVRSRLPLFHERLVPFVECDLGLAIARSEYTSGDDSPHHERYFGPLVRGDVGLTVNLSWRLGLVLSGGYDYAPALANEIKQKHNDGGGHVGAGLRLRGLYKEN
jgi:hypothetical protein